MRKYVLLIALVFMTGFVLASTLGSSPTFLEAKTMSASVKLPININRDVNQFDTWWVMATFYGPPLFPEGQLTSTGEPVGFGSVAVSENPDDRVLPFGSTFTIEGARGIDSKKVFRVSDTGKGVGKWLDIWWREERGSELLTIHVITKGES
jgi:3D (Asp-Asp-Asp) domain-containing protein